LSATRLPRYWIIPVAVDLALERTRAPRSGDGLEPGSNPSILPSPPMNGLDGIAPIPPDGPDESIARMG